MQSPAGTHSCHDSVNTQEPVQESPQTDKHTYVNIKHQTVHAYLPAGSTMSIRKKKRKDLFEPHTHTSVDIKHATLYSLKSSPDDTHIQPNNMSTKILYMQIASRTHSGYNAINMQEQAQGPTKLDSHV